MTGGVFERFRDIVDNRLRPGLRDLGFGEGTTTLAASLADDVLWLVDLAVAPWSNGEKVCFTVSWGVHVLGMDGALGDPAPEVLDLDSCVVVGRAGERPGRLDPRWFEVAARPRPIATVADANVAKHVLGAIVGDVLPRLERLATVADVQAHLHHALLTGRGVPDGEELLTIRRIAALSLLLGDRANAVRWLDHLEARSASRMAPDLVAERIAPLRQRVAS